MTEWPEGNKPAKFSLVEPIVKAIRKAYVIGRRATADISWTGPSEIGWFAQGGCLSPAEALRAEQLRYDEEKQNRTALEVIVGIAIHLGIEQGRRLTLKDLKIPVVLLDMAGSELMLAIEYLQSEIDGKKLEKHEELQESEDARVG